MLLARIWHPDNLPTWGIENKEKIMSSGINWKYRITNANPEEPPISYSIGIGWASGERPCLIVGLVSGLEAVRTAYAGLPGLGSRRQLWLNALSGPTQIADTASKYILDLFARKQGKKSPLIHGGSNIEKCRVDEWFQDSGFVCGREIAEFAGVSMDAPFLANWEALAIAAEEWPRQRWGYSSEVRALKVVDITRHGDYREVEKDEAARVLDAAEAWGRAVNADKDLAHLLNENVVRAAIAVTRKRGSMSGLRHTLRVSGYLR